MKNFGKAFLFFLLISNSGMAQNKISDLNELIGNSLKFADSTRLVAPWPALTDTLRVIIDSDAANEVDDQYAIALALGFPEKIKIEGIVASHYGVRGGSSGIKKSYNSIKEVLEKSGLKTDFEIKLGIPPLTFFDFLPPSDGIDFIIEQAKKASVEKPLWIIALGPATNVAGAILKDPSIMDKIVVFWHGRTQWPQKCWNFNAYNDTKAVQLLFDLPVRLILFDTGTQITMPMEESRERILTKGKLGEYLHQIRDRSPYARQPDKGLFDLGDIAALVDPGICKSEITKAPAVGHDLRYNFEVSRGNMVRIYDIDRNKCFNLLDKALENIKSESSAY
jgi:inosine-uridine nucleoside N-ribohydrolase